MQSHPDYVRLDAVLTHSRVCGFVKRDLVDNCPLLEWASPKNIAHYNTPPSVVTLYCTICSINSPNANLHAIFTPRHMVHLVCSQSVYYSEQIFSH